MLAAGNNSIGLQGGKQEHHHKQQQRPVAEVQAGKVQSRQSNLEQSSAPISVVKVDWNEKSSASTSCVRGYENNPVIAITSSHCEENEAAVDEPNELAKRETVEGGSSSSVAIKVNCEYQFVVGARQQIETNEGQQQEQEESVCFNARSKPNNRNGTKSHQNDHHHHQNQQQQQHQASMTNQNHGRTTQQTNNKPTNNNKEDRVSKKSSISASLEANNALLEVKSNFIKLIRHNKLQYFYLGALIYSVMNICFILQSSVRNYHMLSSEAPITQQQQHQLRRTVIRLHQPMQLYGDLGPQTTVDGSNTRVPSGVGGGDGQLVATNSHLYSSSSPLNGKVKANSFSYYNEHLDEALEPQLGYFLSAGCLFPLTLLLTLIATITTLQFGRQSPSSLAACNMGPISTSSESSATESQAPKSVVVVVAPEQAAKADARADTELESESQRDLDFATAMGAKTREPQTTATGWSRLCNLGLHLSSLQLTGLLLTLALLHLPLALLLVHSPSTGASQNNTTTTATDSSESNSASTSAIQTDFSESNEPNLGQQHYLFGADSNLSLAQQQTASETSNSTRGPIAAADLQSPLVSLAGLGSILALLYLEPLLLEGGPLSGKLICTLTLALGTTSTAILLHHRLITNLQAISSWHLAHSPNQMAPQSGGRRFKLPETAYLYQIGLLLLLSSLTLLAGLLKRRQFVKSVTKLTFAGANQLIEAKVSLEHQRQQQETLLLSVLPAYVAEQVKRNMVKKMTNPLASGSSFESPTGCQPPNSSPNHNNNGTIIGPTSGGGGAPSGSIHVLAHSWLRATTMPSSVTISSLVGSSSAQLRPKQTTGSSSNDNQTGQSESTTNNSSNLLKVVGHQQRSSMSRLSAGVATIGETLGSIGGLKLQHQHSISQLIGPHNQQQQVMGIASGFQSQASFSLPNASASSSSAARRGFNELYIRTYNNVSLLYGDIVGFTRLCTKLSSSQLVKVLNDLFSHFDYLAERHKIMRIKILGDCYYGVSGIPEFAVMGAKSRASRNDNHAINCVNMGLDMIQYIKCLNVERATKNSSTSGSAQNLVQQRSAAPPPPLNERCDSITHSATMDEHLEAGSGPTRSFSGQQDELFGQHQQQQQILYSSASMPQFELNMRIGIHSGHIHSGVIGLKKWQFDVWSNDVSIAMHCESSGVAGRVQVTEATVQQLNGAFSFEPTNSAHCGPASDQFLSSRDIKTYLIRDRVAFTANNSNSLSINQLTATINRAVKLSGEQQQLDRNKLNANLQTNLVKRKQPSENKSKLDNEQRIRTTTIETIRETLLAGESCNSSALNSYGLALDHPDINPLTLTYKDGVLNKLYDLRPIGGYFQDSFVLLILFAILLPTIDYLLSGDRIWSFTFLLLAVLVSLLILISCLDCKLTKQRKSPRPSIIDNNHQSKTSGPPWPSPTQQPDTSELIRGPDHADITINPKPSNLQNNNNQQQQLEADIRASFIDILGRQVLQLHTRLCKRVEPIVRWLEMEVPRKRLKVIAAMATIITVITFQGYIIVELLYNFNNINDDDDGNYQSSNNHGQVIVVVSELYQLTVILLLIAIDLCNHMLSFGTKSVLIIGIICSHLVYMLARPFNIDQYDKLQQQQQQQQQHAKHIYNYVTTKEVIDWSKSTLILMLALWSLAFARQLEYTSRANFLWRNRLNVDHEELEYISGINKVLLENILPSHVVQHYLTHPCDQPKSSRLANVPRMSFSNMRSLSDELYHEQHDSVAVMFASIPHFYEFYDESDISKQGLGCIALLNEIICDFDKLLLKNKFSRIEKIKTIGSTYMAAAGLRPSNLGSSGARSSTVSQNSQVGQANWKGQSLGCSSSSQSSTANPGMNLFDGSYHQETEDLRLATSQQKLNLVCMIQFATSLMNALNGINKQSFQVFKLRVGVNTGPVIAGIIGAQRPFYDIWGDCVNIASRMESLGQVGRIQVEERTAKLLMESLCNETYSIVCRGPIEVKGKGGMITYFVDKKQPATGSNAGSTFEPGQAV